MKLKHLFASVLAMAMVAVACTKEEDAPLGAPSITFEQNTLEFAKEGGSQKVVLTSTRDWTVTCAESWVGLSKVSGKGSTKAQELTISVDPDDSYDRSASVTFVVGDKLVTRNLIVKQAGTGPAPISGVFYEANFKTGGFCDWEADNKNLPDAMTAIWTYNASYGMVATAYQNSVNYASESWLVSPEIDLSQVQSAHMDITHAANYFNNVKNDVTLWLQVAGEEGFTHQLEIPVYPTSFTYLESGDIDLQEFVGKTVRIAFKYVSTSQKAGTYEVSSLKISTDPFETMTPVIPDEGTGSGTAADPYDVAKADAIVSAGAASTDKVYVKGIISKIKEVDPSYGNATYWISDDGSETNQFEIYRGYYLGNVKFTSADQIKLGDEVVVYGQLVDFNGTHEMTQGNYIYSLNGENGGAAPEPGTPSLPEGTLVYGNDFDKEVATNTYGSGSSWPYLDQFEGWKNEKGTGAAGVSYDFKTVSARANSQSNGSYSNYSGSGSTNLFFGADSHFAVKDITLAEGRNYVITFGSEKYLNGGDSNFSKNEFKLYVSNDGAKWVALDYEIGSSDISGKWNINTSETFAVGASDTKLSIYFSASVASAYRLDDLSLIAVDEEGKAIDFSTGVDLGTGSGSDSGSGDQGGNLPGTAASIADIIKMADNTTVQSGEVYVAAVTARGYVALEGGKAVYVYSNDAPAVAVGDKVTFSGKKTTYYGLPEITNPVTTKVSSGNDVPYPAAKDITASFDSYNASEAEYVTFVGTVVKDGSYINFKVDGASKMVGTLSHATAEVSGSFTEGTEVRVNGFFNTLNTTKNLVQVIFVSTGEPSEGGEEGGEEGGDQGDDQPGDDQDGNSVSFDLNQKAQTWTKVSKDATYGDGYTSTTQGVTVTYYKASSSSALAGPAADHFKLYKDFVVKVSSDRKIESVVFTCLTSDKCYALEPIIGAGTAVADTEAKTITWTPETPLEELIAKQLDGQSRISAVTVNYLEETE